MTGEKSTLCILVNASLRGGREEGLGESNQTKITLQNNYSIEKQVEKTNKENMGVKQRKTLDDIKDGDVYHDARIGRDFTKKSKK